MRGGVVAATFLALLLGLPAGSAGARPSSVGGSMTVTASPRTAGAHGVRLKFTLRYEMRCGYPGAGPLVVTFPSALKLPRRFASGAVQLAGKPIAAKVDGRNVTVTVPPHKGVLCNILGPGSLTLTFMRAAKVANPSRPGSYRLRATHADHAFAARLVIKPAR